MHWLGLGVRVGALAVCPPEGGGTFSSPKTSAFLARPADGEHRSARALAAAGVQPADPLPAAGSGL